MGNIYADNLQTGEYALAVWDTQYTGSAENSVSNLDELIIFPNPANGKVSIQYDFRDNTKLEVFTVSGELYKTLEIDNNTRVISIDTTKFPKGSYFLLLSENNGRKIYANGTLIIQ